MPSPSQRPSQADSVSVIVPTYNRRDRLARLLARLEAIAQGGTPFEVIVAVDGATDGTREMLAALAPRFTLRVLEQANAGPASARNHAIRAARGDLLLFLDDDVEPAAGLIERHLDIHRRDEHAVVIGPMLPPPGRKLAPWLAWEAATLQKQYDAMVAGFWAPTPRQFYTANASVRREQALAAGGFDERFRRAEDVEFAYRLSDAGLRFYFVPEAVVLHEPDRTLDAWMRVPRQYGHHDVLMARQRPEILRNAFQEWHARHMLNRALPRWCVGHPRRTRAVISAAAGLLRLGGAVAPKRVQSAICSALWNVQYWRGVAEASGLGPGVWVGLRDPEVVAMAQVPLHAREAVLPTSGPA